MVVREDGEERRDVHGFFVYVGWLVTGTLLFAKCFPVAVPGRKLARRHRFPSSSFSAASERGSSIWGQKTLLKSLYASFLLSISKRNISYLGARR